MKLWQIHVCRHALSSLHTARRSRHIAMKRKAEGRPLVSGAAQGEEEPLCIFAGRPAAVRPKQALQAGQQW